MDDSYSLMDTEALSNLLKVYRKNLAQLEEQKAGHGGNINVPLSISNGILKTQESIEDILQELQRRNAAEMHIEATESKSLINDNERIWLSGLFRHSPAGEAVDTRMLYRELQDDLPDDFDPTSIDNRFCSDGKRITILGRAYIDPDDGLVKNTNSVASTIRDILNDNPNQQIIYAKEIADKISLPIEEVAITLENMAGSFGAEHFHSSGTNFGPRGWASINIENDTIFRRYIRFQSVAALLESLTK
jgi:hypothetical protein